MSSIQTTFKVFVDTNFLISLLKSTDVFHEIAINWYKNLKSNNKLTRFYLSTISISEYCRFGDRKDIPPFFKIEPFNDEHAELSGRIYKYHYSNKKSIEELNTSKNIITNDIKIIAQAAINKPDIFLSADIGLEKIHQKCLSNSLLDYKFINFKNSYNSIQGMFDFEVSLKQ